MGNEKASTDTTTKKDDLDDLALSIELAQRGVICVSTPDIDGRRNQQITETNDSQQTN